MGYGKAIQSARKQKNMTQEQLAQRMYVSKQSVSKWENERSSPDLEKAYQLLEILDMRVAFEELICSSNDDMYAIPVDRVFCHLPEIENIAKQAGKQPTEIRLSKHAFLLFKHLKSWNPDYQVSDLYRNFLLPYCKANPEKKQSTYYIAFNGDDIMNNQNNENMNPMSSSNLGESTIKNHKAASDDCPMIWSQDIRGDRNKNVLVIGGSGTGKSRYVIKPNLLQMDGSYVIADPFGEYLADTGTMFEKNGYKVKVLNFVMLGGKKEIGKVMEEVTSLEYREFEMIGEEKTAFFIVIFTPSLPNVDFLMTAIYHRMIDALYRSREKRFIPEGSRRANIPVHFMMDEFANCGVIAQFARMMPKMNAYNISTLIALQELSQLKKMYNDDWETIIESFDTIIFTGSFNAETLKWISEMTHPYASLEELAELPPDECIVISPNSAPVKSKKYNLIHHPNYYLTAEADQKNLYNR